MSWILKLAQTYDNCSDVIGYSDDAGNMLLPISHSSQNAQIEIVLDMEGTFLDAEYVEECDAETVIPITENTVSKSSGIEVNPLSDKLKYVAGDYFIYAKTSEKKIEKYHSAYMKELAAWANYKNANEKIKSVYKYILKESMMSDLIKKSVVQVDENGKIIGKEADSFVRFKVEDLENPYEESALWKSKEIFDNYEMYYFSTLEENDICYATGERKHCSLKHPSRLRYGGDMTKIISSNDETGFTFRGRFVKKEEACAVSYEVSQKAHNALKWLIQRENIRFGDMVMVVFRTNDGAILDFVNAEREEGEAVTDSNDDIKAQPCGKPDNGEMYAKNLKSDIYRGTSNLYDDDDIVVMTLESATEGKGRLSVTYYREMSDSLYKRSIDNWKYGCRWYYYDTNVGSYKDYHPALDWIVRSVYGVERGNFIEVNENKQKKKLTKMTISRLIPCVIEGKPIPQDLINRVVINASRPESFNSKNWNWLLRNACAMVHKHYVEKGDEYLMELEERRERDYLYGRLLAVADKAESDAMRNHGGSERSTNAQRYMAAFQKRPFTTWTEIVKKIQPYLGRMEVAESERYHDLLENITNMFDYDEFKRNEPLNGTYLLGYSNQKKALVHKEGKKDE